MKQNKIKYHLNKPDGKKFNDLCCDVCSREGAAIMMMMPKTYGYERREARWYDHKLCIDCLEKHKNVVTNRFGQWKNLERAWLDKGYER